MLPLLSFAVVISAALCKQQVLLWKKKQKQQTIEANKTNGLSGIRWMTLD
jgi:hypothetical protein